MSENEKADFMNRANRVLPQSDISVGFSVYYDPTVNAFGTLTGELTLSTWTVITVEKPVIVLSNGLGQMRLDYGEFWDGSWVPEVGQVIGIDIDFSR